MKTKKRFLSILLSLALVLGLLPGMSLTAYAENDFSSYVNTTSTLRFNELDWYVIAADDDTVTLLTKEAIGLSEFGSNNTYSGSTVEGYLNGLTAENGSFAGVADAIAPTDLTDVGVTGAKLYLLSTSEAYAVKEDVRKCEWFANTPPYDGGWWLRTPGVNSTDKAAIVSSNDGQVVLAGLHVTDTTQETGAVRPALRLDLSKVTFANNAFTLGSATVDVTGVTLDKTATLTVGGTKTLTATVSPEGATNKTVTWSSSDTSVAKVDEYGVVTAVAEGTATIKATATNGTPDDTSDDKSDTCTVTVEPVAVTGVTLDETATLTVGETKTLTATVSPEDATHKTVTWSSDNTDVATVADDGTVTAVGKGTATITAAAANGKSATCTVTVIVPIAVTGVKLNKTGTALEINGATETLTVTFEPSDATDKTIIWSSDNTSVATVDNNGVVTPGVAGYACITATATNGTEDKSDDQTATCLVRVFHIIDGVTLDKPTATLYVGGATEQLTATVSPENATFKYVTWSSDNTSVATVDKYGIVTAVSLGTANITVTATNDTPETTDDKTATCVVTVAPLSVERVSPNVAATTLFVGDTETLTAAVEPANATDQTVTWSSSDESVATVDAYGVVTAVAAGEATITATATNGEFESKTATVTVSVLASAGTYQASVGTDGYETLKAAITAAKAGDTVKLLADVTFGNEFDNKNIYINKKDLTIDLNGFGIKVTSADYVLSFMECKVTLKDSNPARDGGENRPNGVFGGYLTGGKSSGVLVYGGATFTMNGGAITGNGNLTDGYGGVDNSGTFIMNGGAITNNQAKNGGGVYTSTGRFTMNGGVISNNTAAENGGGVSSGSDLTITGGTITKNTAESLGGGVYSGGPVVFKFNLSGAPVIEGNKVGGTDSNVYLAKPDTVQRTITITGALANTVHIGVSMAEAGVFTSGLKGKGTGANFASEMNGYSVVLDNDGNAKLVEHVHDFTYALASVTSANDSITATCGTTTPNCDLPDNKVTLTLTPTAKAAPDTPPSGTIIIVNPANYQATLTGLAAFNSATALGIKQSDVKYYNTEDGVKTGDALERVPHHAGTYCAEITVGEKTASIVYTIEALKYPGMPTEILADPTDKTITVNAPAQSGGKYEYQVEPYDGGTASDWTTTPKFEGLEPHTKYYVRARMTEHPEDTVVETTRTTLYTTTITGTAQVGEELEAVVEGLPSGEDFDFLWYVGTIDSPIYGNPYTIYRFISVGNHGETVDAVGKQARLVVTTKSGVVVGRAYSDTIAAADKQALTADDFTYIAPEGTDANLRVVGYDGNQKAATVACTKDGVGEITVEYWTGTDFYSTTAPTDVGAYTVKISIPETDTYCAVEHFTAEGWQFTVIPTGVTANNRSYDGSAQPLVTVDESTPAGRAMQYVLGSDDSNPPTAGYTASIPAATDAGTYYVWYKVPGDAQHSEVPPACVSVTVTPASVTLTADSGTVTYDGTEKSVTGFTSSVAGLTFSGVSVSGSGTNAGSYDVTFSGVTLNETKDSTGNYVVTGTANGKLTVGPAGVTLTANSDTKTYTGAEQTVTGFTSSVEGLTFPGVSASGSGTVEGRYDVTLSGVTVNTTTDSTGNYVVTATANGTLTVNAIGVTLTANSGTETYDGTEKSVSGFTSSVAGLTFTGVSASGSGTNAGRYDVTFSGVTVNETKDSTGNYVVTATANGALTISTAGVTLTANSGTETYDGTEKSVTGFTSSVAGLTFSGVSAGGSGTNAGSYDVTFSGVTVNETKDSTGNYVVTATANGKLTINAIGVTLTANSGTETYDGTEKSVSGFTSGVEGLTFTGVSASGSGTNAGSYDVAFSGVTLNETKDSTGNYVVTATANGTLTVDPAGVTLTANSGTETYDGAEKRVTGFTSGVEGLTFTGVSASGSGTNVGEYDVTFTGVTVNETKDSTGNYVVTGTANGTLTVSKATMPAPTLQLVTLVTMQQKTPKTKWVYGETDVVPDVTGNASGGVVTTFYSDGGSEMPTDAGTYTVWASIAATANYYGVEKTNEVSFTITKAPHSDVTAAQTVTVSRNGVTDGKLDLGAYLADATGWTVKSTDGTLITAASNGGGTVLNYTAAQTEAVSSSGGVEITVTSRNYEDYTLTVNFRTASAFTLRFESNGGTEIPSRVLSEDAAYGPLPTAAQVRRAGYTFDGWYTDAAFTAPASAETSIGSADATVYAKWTVERRTITLDLNGYGTNTAIDYSAADADFDLPVPADIKDRTPTYTFAGWQKNGTEPAQIHVTIIVADLENASYTASWVVGEKVGEVTFEKGNADTDLMGLASMDEGTVSTGSGSTADAGQAAQKLADVMKEVACEQSDAGDAENTVTVAMDLKPVDDTDPTKLDADTREAMDKIKEASGSGDETVKDDLVNISVTQTTTDENDAVVNQKTLPDIGRVVEIPLQYNLTGRYRPQIFHYHDGRAIEFTRLASRPVSSFTNGTFYVSGSGASAIIYIYTQYFSIYSITTTETPTHTVMFETNGGSEIGSVTVVDQQRLKMPGEPTKDSQDEVRSYVFDGWYAASDFSVAYDFDAPVTRDMTLYAKWREIITYTVTLHRNDGTDAAESRKTDGNGRITLPAPTRSGYRFSGWYTAQTGGEPVADDTIYTADTDLYARWTHNSSGGGYSGGGIASTYTVNVTQAQNGTVKADKTSVASGSKVTLTVTPEQGYKLNTLTVTDSSGQEIALTKAADGTYGFTMPAGNVTVKASFVKEDAEPVPAEHPNYQECLHDAACPMNDFSDLEPMAWYHDGVHYVLDNGIMGGTGGGKFEPNTATTRAMIVTILWRLEGEPEADYAMAFADVPEGQWYTEAIRWAASTGIVSGYSDVAFGPNDAITREQLSAILYRYAQSKGADVSIGEDTNLLSFADAGDWSDWSVSALQWAVGSGIINGKDGKLVPKGDASRAEAATMLMRYCTLNAQ